MNISIKKLLVMGSWLLVAVPSFLPAQQVVTTQQAERNYKHALANYVKHPTITHAQQLERNYNLLAQSPQRKVTADQGLAANNLKIDSVRAVARGAAAPPKTPSKGGQVPPVTENNSLRPHQGPSSVESAQPVQERKLPVEPTTRAQSTITPAPRPPQPGASSSPQSAFDVSSLEELVNNSGIEQDSLNAAKNVIAAVTNGTVTVQEAKKNIQEIISKATTCDDQINALVNNFTTYREKSLQFIKDLEQSKDIKALEEVIKNSEIFLQSYDDLKAKYDKSKDKNGCAALCKDSSWKNLLDLYIAINNNSELHSTLFHAKAAVEKAKKSKESVASKLPTADKQAMDYVTQMTAFGQKYNGAVQNLNNQCGGLFNVLRFSSCKENDLTNAINDGKKVLQEAQGLQKTVAAFNSSPIAKNIGTPAQRAFVQALNDLQAKVVNNNALEQAIAAGEKKLEEVKQQENKAQLEKECRDKQNAIWSKIQQLNEDFKKALNTLNREGIGFTGLWSNTDEIKNGIPLAEEAIKKGAALEEEINALLKKPCSSAFSEEEINELTTAMNAIKQNIDSLESAIKQGKAIVQSKGKAPVSEPTECDKQAEGLIKQVDLYMTEYQEHISKINQCKGKSGWFGSSLGAKECNVGEMQKNITAAEKFLTEIELYPSTLRHFNVKCQDQLSQQVKKAFDKSFNQLEVLITKKILRQAIEEGNNALSSAFASSSKASEVPAERPYKDLTVNAVDSTIRSLSTAVRNVADSRYFAPENIERVKSLRKELQLRIQEKSTSEQDKIKYASALKSIESMLKKSVPPSEESLSALNLPAVQMMTSSPIKPMAPQTSTASSSSAPSSSKSQISGEPQKEDFSHLSTDKLKELVHQLVKVDVTNWSVYVNPADKERVENLRDFLEVQKNQEKDQVKKGLYKTMYDTILEGLQSVKK